MLDIAQILSTSLIISLYGTGVLFILAPELNQNVHLEDGVQSCLNLLLLLSTTSLQRESLSF